MTSSLLGQRIDAALSASGALDTRALATLKREARSGDANLRVAREFESLLGNLLLKSMRAALPGGDPLASPATQMATSLLDQQLAAGIAGRGLGLAVAIARQMNGQKTATATATRATAAEGSAAVATAGAALKLRMAAALYGSARPVAPGDDDGAAESSPAFERAAWMPVIARVTGRATEAPAAPIVPAASPALAADRKAPGRPSATGDVPAAGATPVPARIAAFVSRFGRIADEVARMSGLPATAILGQAALESGWGRREIRAADGSNSFNVFGIKAGKGWEGRTVDAVTTENVDGREERRVERFRAYDGYREAFADYVQLLAGNPRYRGVLAQAHDAQAFVEAMGRSGYATDPAYGEKLSAVVRRLTATGS